MNATKRWQKSGVNLYRYVPTGDYYARAKVGGKLREKKLNTDKVTVARLRLADFLREEREKVERQKNLARGSMTMADAIAKLKSDLDAEIESGHKKPKTKIYRMERLEALKKTWPDFENQDIAKITVRDCDDWQKRFAAKTKSATSFNNTVSTLRMLLKIGFDNGARYDNPADKIKLRTPHPKKQVLPSRAEFLKLLAEVEKVKVGRVRMCSELIQFLAFSGVRKGEAARVNWGDCDFGRGVIDIKGDPVTGTKNWEIRKIPMIPEMRLLLERMRESRPEETLADRVTQVKECQGVLTRACKAAGIARLTHHDMRDLFATLAIESGVDIPTVAKWLGHKDGGALLMKTYSHLRQDHSLLMAQKVNFGTAAAPVSGTVAVKETIDVANGNQDTAKLIAFPEQPPVNQTANTLLTHP